MAVITIFHASRCHGNEVADAVAKQTGCERIEDRLFADASRRFQVSKEKLLGAMTGPAPFWNRFTHEREKNLARLRVVLADLVADDSKLLVGLAAHLVPRDLAHVLRVCVVANFGYRVRQAALETGKAENEVSELLRGEDAELLEWTRYLYEKPPYEEELYDLVVPMQDQSVAAAAGLICEQAKSSSVAVTEVSRVAARDFQLAALVGLELAQANHDVDVRARHGEITIALKQHVLMMAQYQRELRGIAEKVSGVDGVKFGFAPRYKAPAINTMSNVELPPKILLVDDEKDFVQTVSERLKTRNLDSSVVYNGQQALDYVESDQPDVVVVDLMMPGIGGIEVLRRIKKTHPNIEVIVLTGHGSEQEERLAAELGAFAYLQKPVNIDILARTMREAYQKVNETRAKSPPDARDREAQ